MWSLLIRFLLINTIVLPYLVDKTISLSTRINKDPVRMCCQETAVCFSPVIDRRSVSTVIIRGTNLVVVRIRFDFGFRTIKYVKKKKSFGRRDMITCSCCPSLPVCCVLQVLMSLFLLMCVYDREECMTGDTWSTNTTLVTRRTCCFEKTST
jgi:hypothetical protein